MRKFIKIIIITLAALIAAAIAAALVAIGVARNLNEPPDTEARELVFEVRPGESAQAIGGRLEGAGVIKSRYFWYILNRYEKKSLKAGTYKLELPKSQTGIYAILVEGRQALIRVTVPEGVTLSKTARIFSDAGICGEDAFLEAASDPATLAAYQIPAKTMEGYLYPDTYLFQEGYPAGKVVAVLAETFFKRLAGITDASGLSPAELFDKVILASIVEREYRVDEEAPLMAGVFYNRLKIGMALQSCATVEYVITEIQHKPHPEVLYTRDTEIKNPYNTYKNKGLPPGPISAPGLVALNAAFNTAPSDFLYFRLIDADAGRHYFSKTFDDHIKAGLLYVKKR